MYDKIYKDVDIFCIFSNEDKSHMYIGYSSNSHLYFNTIKCKMSPHRKLTHSAEYLNQSKQGLEHFINYVRNSSCEELSWNFEIIENVTDVCMDTIKQKIKNWQDKMEKIFNTTFLNRTDNHNKTKESYRIYRREYYHKAKLIKTSSIYKKRIKRNKKKDV